MAENQGGAQNRLGELFVEFGSKGLPGLLKNMNTLSATFLLGKNSANQLLQTITALPKEGAKSATEIGKMSNSLATTSKEYQKLSMYLKSKNVSEGLLNEVANLEKTFYDFHTGIAGLPGEVSTAFSKLGLNEGSYFGDFDSILNLLDDVKEATKNWDTNERNQAFRQLGLSSEWGYLWDRGDFNLRDSAAISDEALEKNIKAGESMAELKVATDSLKYELISKIAPSLTAIANWLTGKTLNAKEGKYDNIVKPGISTISSMFGGAIGTGTIGAKGNLSEDFSQQNSKSILNTELKPGSLDVSLPQLISPPDMSDDNISGNPPPIQSLSMGGSGFIPSNISTSNLTNYIEINNTNHIVGDNGSEIADQIASMNAEDIQYTQYQVQNRAMV